MTAITVEQGRGCRGDRAAHVRFMTGDRPRRGRRRYGHGPGGLGFGFGHGRRSRGDIRAAILALLSEEPMHGYQIIQVLSERSGGNWTPSPGSVYPTLQQLEDEGLIEPVAGESGRRAFALTEEGRAAAAAGPASPWEEAAESADTDLVELRDLVHQVLEATRQVAQAGTVAQIKAAQDVLRTARKSIYKLLAED